MVEDELADRVDVDQFGVAVLFGAAASGGALQLELQLARVLLQPVAVELVGVEAEELGEGVDGVVGRALVRVAALAHQPDGELGALVLLLAELLPDGLTQN